MKTPSPPETGKHSLQELSLDKQRLLQLLLEKKARQTEALRPYPRGSGPNGSARMLASWAQQRLWFIDQLGSGSAPYHIEVALRLRGRLDEEALHQALDSLMQRHEVLRTTFVAGEDVKSADESSAEGGPQQDIAQEGHFALRTIDLRGCTATESDARVLQQRTEEAYARFDLRTGPLVRGLLIKLQDEEHVLHVTIHHIVSDAWSTGILTEELARLYEAHREKDATGSAVPRLEPLPIQYADYTRWQRDFLKGEVLNKQLEYWRQRLQGAAPELALPTDKPRPPTQSYRGGRASVVLDRQLTVQLKKLAQRYDVTLFMLLHAAWSILLARLSGQSDVVVGTAIANRQRPEIQRLIGLFVNTLVLRLEVDEDLTLEEFLARVREVTLGAYAHQDVPFERVVEMLQPQRSLDRNPLFQVMLTLQSAPKSRLQMHGLTVHPEEPVNQSSMVDLLLSLEERDWELVGAVDYAADLFNPETIERWMRSFTVLLQDMVRGTRSRIGQLSILPEDVRRQVTQLFNPPYAGERPLELLHELFEFQVSRDPQARAVVYEGQSLTYGELNTRANRLARYLRSRGMGPDQLVGLCVERGLEMVVGIVGILKAGGAYVPLDPAYPPDRLGYMVNDAAPQVVLIQERLRDRLPSSTAELIALDADRERIDAHSGGNLPQGDFRCGQLAYVIYTSGSTGRPKGVMVEHRNVTRLFTATQQWFGFNARDVWTLFHSYAFDFSVWELWGALLYGGRVVVVPYLTARTPRDFYRLVCDEGVTVLNQTPSAFAQFMEAQAQQKEEQQQALRVVIFGGEALEFRMLRPWVERNGAERPQLVNMYGITETTVHVTYRLLSADEIATERGSLVGRPIGDLRVYLLDRHGEPVPIGVPGEMYVGGAGVARGYLNRVELTAERFLKDPFSEESEGRMYRTGDLGRWRTDGTIEYLGRNDQQVKIRGFRIELGEIEAQLVRHPQVKEAVVIAREDATCTSHGGGRKAEPGSDDERAARAPVAMPGEKRLVGYLVPRDGISVEIEELRAHLKATLPEHMVPAAFLVLESLPLTSNGKLDRRALPAPEQGAYVSRQYEAPQGEIEEILSGIWQDLLRVPRVGRQDNFFELGGHSLLIVQLMERLRRVGLSGEIRRVFESQTLAELAGALSRGVVAEAEVPPNRIPPGCEAITPAMLPLVELSQAQIDRIAQQVPGGAANIQDIYPLAPLQEGILFHHLLDEQDGDTYVVVMLLSVCSRQRLEELIAALQGVIDRHDILHTAVLWEQLPRPVQVVYRQAELPVELITLKASHIEHANGAVPHDSDDPDVPHAGARDGRRALENGSVLEQLQEQLRTERLRLDLRQAPLLRAQIAADPHNGQWYLQLQLHHITCDHVTTEAVISEVVAQLSGRAQTLPASVPYRNHVAQVLAHARSHDAEAFFHSRLADVEEPSAPFGLLDVHGGGSRIEEAHQELESSLSSRIRAQARRLGVSAATLFHAAWGLVVAGTSGRDDVVLGSVLLGRLQSTVGTQRVLGMFINTLPLRLKLQELSARELVERTQRELVELLNHEQASLAVAQRCSGLSGGVPLFTTLLNYRHSGVQHESDWEAAEGIRLLGVRERTNYPITVSVDDQGEGFGLQAQTDPRITPGRIVGYLRTAVESLVRALEESPGTPALDLGILPADERREVIELFNATAVPYQRGKLVHQLFEEQVQRTPLAIALVFESKQLTYAALNAKANQLARWLSKQGVGPDALVGVCLERSLEMVIGLLGVLKAGGAYVPLDPGYPSDRLQYMLEDAAPRVLLTQKSLLAQLPQTNAVTIELDANWNVIAQEDTHNPDCAGLNDTHLAYMIYTSGSTGRPKGAMNEHRGVVNRLQWMQDRYQLDLDDRILQKTPFSFDVSVWEFFWTLMSGARLIVARPEGHKDPAYLRELIESTGVTRLHFVPSMLQGFLDQYPSGACASLRHIICSGEELSVGLQRQCLECLPQARLSNLYGPTEAAVDVTAWECSLEDDSPRVPIGRPISNICMYVLDPRQRPVPLGVIGEVCIAGIGVGRGYLNRPELTAERFLRDPFSSDRQARLYRTGDLGRWRTDGALEYLGRNDTQIKIRGFRIELGEIEARIAQHEQVKETVVLAREDVAGEKRLVAYLTPINTTADLSAETLRAHLKSTLPDHMIPSAFVVLERFPLSPNGKLDRRALPAPELDAFTNRAYEGPQGDTEEQLARIWRGLLRLERVGRHDSFFELGGHSLLAMQMVVRIQASLSVDVAMRVLFTLPNLEKLAAHIDELRQSQLLSGLAAGGTDMEELLASVASMPEQAAQELLRELTK
jgi:amino acid adenylation domain-containing protein